MATTSERKTVALSLGCAMGADVFPIAVWRKAGVFLEHLNEVVHIVDATVGSNLLNRQGGQSQQGNALFNSLGIDILRQCAAIFFVEKVGKIAGVDAQLLRNALQP